MEPLTKIQYKTKLEVLFLKRSNKQMKFKEHCFVLKGLNVTLLEKQTNKQSHKQNPQKHNANKQTKQRPQATNQLTNKHKPQQPLLLFLPCASRP